MEDPGDPCVCPSSVPPFLLLGTGLVLDDPNELLRAYCFTYGKIALE